MAKFKSAKELSILWDYSVSLTFHDVILSVILSVVGPSYNDVFAAAYNHLENILDFPISLESLKPDVELGVLSVGELAHSQQKYHNYMDEVNISCLPFLIKRLLNLCVDSRYLQPIYEPIDRNATKNWQK